MGLTFTYNRTLEQVSGSERKSRGTVAFTGLYAINGEAFTARNVGLSVVNQFHAYPSLGYVFEWDKANKKLKAFYADNNAVSDSALIEVPDTTDLTALTAVKWEASGT